MKFEKLAAKKFSTSENANLKALVGGDTTSSYSSTVSKYGYSDTRIDADSYGGGGTSSVSVVNGVVTYDA